MIAANDNVPATYEAYLASGEIEPGKGRQINVIDVCGDPIALSNTAMWYAAKEEPWADVMAGRLRFAAGAMRRAA